jgi:hypothetical protein
MTYISVVEMTAEQLDHIHHVFLGELCENHRMDGGVGSFFSINSSVQIRRRRLVRARMETVCLWDVIVT